MSDIMELFKKISQQSTTSGPPEYIICGLGNPGDKYARTRHNAGFMAMDYLSQKCGIEIKRLRFKSLTGEGTVDGKRVLFMKPQTFMNLSGEAVQEAMNFYKIPVENIIVFSDDVNLAPGRMRIRKSGSDGGQRGLRSIITILNSDQFPRVRLGVGEKPHKDYDMADWVLGNLSDEDCKNIYPCLEATYEIIKLIMAGKTDDAMGRFNGMKPKAKEEAKPSEEEKTVEK
ncbi:MAG: aminoacyl-tRNA hydrolase [Ruminococcaceae bacterium]|nr:aminoacyl-tRNA hydrolase [Oscillospiraceae bacterium]